MANFKKKHGMIGTRFYQTWQNMKKRCLNPNREDFKRYGGKGIKVSDEWMDFTNFMNDMHKSYLEHAEKHGEKNTTLDRINSKGDYQLSNCRWATKEEQHANRNASKLYSIDNEQLDLKQISEKFNIPYRTLRSRLRTGLTIEQAAKMPVKTRGGNRWHDNFNKLRG